MKPVIEKENEKFDTELNRDSTDPNSLEMGPSLVEEVLTISEMGKRLKISKATAYDLANRKGFPLHNLGGERSNRVIWSEVIEYIRKL